MTAQTTKLTPKEAIRAQCINCVGADRLNADVKNCTGSDCVFWPYRNGKRASVKVHRKFCLQCAGGSYDYIEECPTLDCPVYPYRMGKNPAMAGRVGTFKRKSPEPGA